MNSMTHSWGTVRAEVGVFTLVLAVKDVELKSVLETEESQHVFASKTQVLEP